MAFTKRRNPKYGNTSDNELARIGDINNIIENAVAKDDLFLSVELTGTGSAQSTAHGFGSIPSKVIVIPTTLTAGLAGGFSTTYGTHTETYCITTVTNGEKYKIVAIK